MIYKKREAVRNFHGTTGDLEDHIIWTRWYVWGVMVCKYQDKQDSTDDKCYEKRVGF